jgi:DNA-binding response OmpR family regulator
MTARREGRVRAGGDAETSTVLIVEDDARAAKLLSLYVGQANWRPVVARDGREALAQALRLRPSAILLDLLLPELDGWEVLSALKASPETAHIPVIILSVLDKQDLGFRMGAADYLVKPVGRLALMRALRRCALQQELPACTRRVLLVHDDPNQLQGLAVALTDQGYDVFGALGGAEGICLAKCVRPSVVIQLFVAGSVYVDVVTALRSDPLTTDVPILVVSRSGVVQEAWDDLGGPVRHLLASRRGWEEELLEQVRHILRSRAAA